MATSRPDEIVRLLNLGANDRSALAEVFTDYFAESDHESDHESWSEDDAEPPQVSGTHSK